MGKPFYDKIKKLVEERLRKSSVFKFQIAFKVKGNKINLNTRLFFLNQKIHSFLNTYYYEKVILYC